MRQRLSGPAFVNDEGASPVAAGIFLLVNDICRNGSAPYAASKAAFGAREWRRLWRRMGAQCVIRDGAIFPRPASAFWTNLAKIFDEGTDQQQRLAITSEAH